MILRMWHGYTAPQGADAYEAMLRETILRASTAFLVIAAHTWRDAMSKARSSS